MNMISPDFCIIMLHGYNSNADNMQSLHYAFEDKLLCFSLQAKFKGTYSGGYMWFPLDDDDASFLVESSLRDESLQYIDDYLTQIEATHHIKRSNMFLLGFSQGAMIASEFALTKSDIAGAILYSGAIIVDQPPSKKTPLCLLHGDNDNVVDIAWLHKSVDYCNRYHLDCESHILPNVQHYITESGLAICKSFVDKVLNRVK